RSRLAQTDTRDVELALDARVVAVVVVDRADVGEHLAGPWVDRHESRVPDVSTVQPVHPFADLPLADLLFGHVERRRDAVATAGHRGLISTEDLSELVAHLEDEVRGFDRRDRRARDL